MQLYHRADLEQELEKFKLLKSRVSAVITTNYDLFLEKHVFPKDYTVFIHQEDLFGADSYNIAEIYKIHSSAMDPNSIIITKDDYDRFSSSRKLIIAKMLTLFSESPIVFMGYSLTDKNIRSIIIDFINCLSKEQLETISSHFVFISYKPGETDLTEIKSTIITQAGDIPITEIQTDNFSKVFDTLNQITPGISPARVRETRRVIKRIVDTSISSEEATSVIVGLDDLENMDLSSKPLAIAIGYRDSILSKVGYGIINDDLIMEDLLFDNKHFDAYSMCFERFRSLPYTRLLPVFKYVKGANCPIPKDSKLGIYIDKHNSKEKIITANARKCIKNYPECHTLEDLFSEMGKVDKVHKKAGVLLKNISNLRADQIREVCISLFEYDRAGCNCSNFKRCIMYLDFIENFDGQKENQ